MAQSVLALLAGIPDTGIGQSRYLQDAPNSDGMIMTPAGALQASGPNAFVLTRSGKGLWQLTRTAAGAETYFIRTTLGQMQRIGQAYQFGGFGPAGISSSKPPYVNKGVGVIDAFVALQIGVVALTSATLRIGKVVYSATLAPVVTDIVAATALGSVATNANPLIQTLSVPVNTQQFTVDDLALLEVELSIVMANTGTVGIAGIGAHLGFNFN